MKRTSYNYKAIFFELYAFIILTSTKQFIPSTRVEVNAIIKKHTVQKI